MTDLNQCNFTGRVGKEPTVRAMKNGNEVISFSLAVDGSYKDKNGSKVEKVNWISVVVYQKGLVGVIKSYVKKGSRLMISGCWENSKWTDNSGVEKYRTDLVLQGFDSKLIMLDTKDSSNNAHNEAKQEDTPPYNPIPMNSDASGNIEDDIDGDEIPF